MGVDLSCRLREWGEVMNNAAGNEMGDYGAGVGGRGGQRCEKSGIC